jgi:hypothetical protein
VSQVRGSGATPGDIKRRVASVGPQVGYFLLSGRNQRYVGLNGTKQ